MFVRQNLRDVRCRYADLFRPSHYQGDFKTLLPYFQETGGRRRPPANNTAAPLKASLRVVRENISLARYEMQTANKNTSLGWMTHRNASNY